MLRLLSSSLKSTVTASFILAYFFVHLQVPTGTVIIKKDVPRVTIVHVSTTSNLRTSVVLWLPKGVCTLRSSGYSCVHVYSRKSFTGKLNTDAIVLDLFDEQATKLSFKNIDILPSNNKEGATTVVCDPDVFSEADRANLGFECLKGTFKET